jgi:nicotinate-nucleotide--dimethylbenzimidazole phosphoribosyltransferase
MERLNEILKKIQPLYANEIKKTQLRLDQLTKPLGSLGKLEEIAVQVAGIRGTRQLDLSKKSVIVMAADHGVCEEGVSAFPQEVTQQMVHNFLNGGAAVNVLALHAGADVLCVDIGVKGRIEHPNLIARKIKNGTDNITKGPAMLREEALQAIQVGIDVVEKLSNQGCGLIATGEMGIGNTTSSAAILVALTGTDIKNAVGRGTGIDDKAWIHKQNVVRKAIKVNQPNSTDPLDVLTKLGGLEIAGLVGAILGAARFRIPVVIDGFISSAAALVAARLAPITKEYMIPSHRSQEQGHLLLLDSIGLKPMMEMDMRLGEGTGAVLCFPIIDASLRLLNEMATFANAGIANKKEDQAQDEGM